MRKLLTALAAAATLTIATAYPAGVANAAPDGLCDNPPQSGDTTITSGSNAPSPVVVGLKKVVTSTYTVVVTDSCPLQVTVSDFFLHGYPGVDFIDPRATPFTGTSDGKGTWTFTGTLAWDPTVIPDDYAGGWSPQIFAYGSGYTESDDPAFSVLRASRLSTKATPGHVKKGKQLTVKGHLRRADWEQHAWVGAADQTVRLQFRKRHGDYTDVTSAATSSSGRVVIGVTAKTNGCYRFVFAGDGYTAPLTSAADCVRVR